MINIGVTFLGKWSFVSQRNPWISVFDVVLSKVELKMWFLQLLTLNLPKKLVFSSKTMVLAQKLQFSQKPQFFSFLPEISTGKHLWPTDLWPNERPLA